MKRLLALALAPLLALAGCGGDTCRSSAAPLANGGGQSCALPAGQEVTFNVALNCKCTDTSPTCQAEFVNGGIEVQPVFQQCQENSGCAIDGCPLGRPTATCSVTLPANLSGTVPLTVVGDSIATGSVTIGGSSTQCNL